MIRESGPVTAGAPVTWLAETLSPTPSPGGDVVLS